MQLATEAPDAPTRTAIKTRAVESLVRQGQVGAARDALQVIPGQVSASLYALVDTAAGAPHGLSMLDERLSQSRDMTSARHAVLGRVYTNRGVEVPALFASLPPELRDVGALRDAQYVAHVRGDFLGAAHIGEQVLQLVPVGADTASMFNTACSWARVGDNERALSWLACAIDFGWTDLTQLSTDHDLSTLWSDPRFHALRTRLGAPQ